MPHKRYIIFCDESDDKGRYYSNFYGGALIEASRQQALQRELQIIKDEINVFSGEMKWEKITEPYVDKYIRFVNAVFDIIDRGDMKVRIMFTQNRNLPVLDECIRSGTIISCCITSLSNMPLVCIILFRKTRLRQPHCYSMTCQRMWKSSISLKSICPACQHSLSGAGRVF